MTDIDLPSAAEALAMAYAIVKSPCSAAETERATLLFEIGRELRIAADMRAINARRAALDEARNYRVKTPSPAAYEPTPVGWRLDEPTERYATMMRGYAGEPAAARVERLIAERLPDFAATQVFPKVEAEPVIDEPTTRMPIVWQAGNKADCAHCHTPIVYGARRMADIVLPDEDDPQYVWVHKYSDQRICADVHMSPVEGGGEGHTFAEPSR